MIRKPEIDEEHVDADEAAGQRRRPQVADDDERDRDRPKRLDLRPDLAPERRRRHRYVTCATLRSPRQGVHTSVAVTSSSPGFVQTRIGLPTTSLRRASIR